MFGFFWDSQVEFASLGNEFRGRDLQKPFLHTGSWYRMGSRQSSMIEKLGSSAQVIRDSSVSVVLCTLIVALGPIQFGFTVTHLPFLAFL